MEANDLEFKTQAAMVKYLEFKAIRPRTSKPWSRKSVLKQKTSWTEHTDNITASVTTLGCVSSITFSPDTSLMSSDGRSVFSTICSDILLMLQIDQQNIKHD